MNTKLLNDRNLQIGNICFQWAHLEYLLALTAASLLGVDVDTGKIITSGLRINERIGLSIKLADHLNAPKGVHEALLQVRKDLQDKGKNLLERRNRAVHGHRLLDSKDPTNEWVEVSFGREKNKRVSQTNKDLALLGKDIAATSKDFYGVMTKLGVYNASLARPREIV